MKTHVEPTIRDIPSLLALAPWYGKKHRDNTLTMKRFSNGRGFWCLGGKAAKTTVKSQWMWRVMMNLLPLMRILNRKALRRSPGDKRIEGSVYLKSIRGSTPKVRGTCQIERAASESPHFMRFHVACPHCGRSSILNLATKRRRLASNGRRMTPPACFISASIMPASSASRSWTLLMPVISAKRPIWTRDGILWFSSSGEEIEPPDSVTFHIWTAYSPFTTWVQIVKDWMKTKGDTGKRKTFRKHHAR